MEILIGLVIATVVVIGWGYGSLPVAVFLTLADLFGMTLIGLFRDQNTTLQVTALISVMVIWAPVLVKRIRSTPIKQHDDRPTISLTSRSEDIVGGVLTVLSFLAVGWMFMHDATDSWYLISSRPFLTMIGFATLAGLGIGWANKSV